MAEERNVGLARAPENADDADSTKAELQRRMDEARESISQTVTEIKDTVVNQYQQVKETINDSLDWREQYRRHTVPFTVGAFAVGALVGYGVMGAFTSDGDNYDEEEAFDRIDAGFDRAVARSYASAPILGRSSSSSGREADEDVGPETRPSYGGSHQASPARQPQGFASQTSAAPEEEEEEPKGPGIFERFRETKAYDKLQSELSTLGERFVEELSRTAQVVVVPALLGKLKDLIGIDLSTQREVAQRSRVEQQAAQSNAQTASAASGSSGS
ncbi:MAG: hypothetical protein QOJ76_3078 [Acidobacteriota bacterium]|jgi:hypothetical protein|nr:hypothetical protein [Acidobacteriota bacterium]